MAKLFSIFEDKCILKMTALILNLQSDSLLLYVYSCIRRKQKNLRNEQGYISTKRQSERTLMYLLFPQSGLDPGVHLGDCLWKVSNIK